MGSVASVINWAIVNWPIIIAPLLALIVNDLVYINPKLKANTLISFLLPILQKYYPAPPAQIPPADKPA